MMKNEKYLFDYLLEQRVKEHYQNAADIGPIIELHHQLKGVFFDIDVKYSKTTNGWNIDSNKRCKVIMQKHIYNS